MFIENKMNILICLNIFKINIEQSRPSSWKIQDLAIKQTLLTVQCTTKKDNMMKTFTLLMILSLGVLHCQTAERRPPPPPGFNDKGSSGSFGPPGLPSSFGGPSVQALKPNGGSGGGISFGSSFGFRWVYCNRSWKKVQFSSPKVSLLCQIYVLSNRGERS